jgi:hypothetical protein
VLRQEGPSLPRGNVLINCTASIATVLSPLSASLRIAEFVFASVSVVCAFESSTEMSADFASISKRLSQPIAARSGKPMKILSRSLTNRSLPIRGVYAVEEEAGSPTPMSEVDQELLAKFVKRSSIAEPRGSQFFAHNDRPTSSVSSPSSSLLTGRSNTIKRVSTSATNVRVMSALCHSKHEEDQEQEEPESSTDEDTKKLSTESLLDAQAAEVRLRPRAQSSGRPYTPFETRAATAAAMYKVLEFLHCGNIESAFNAQLLCRLRIGFLLDATGLEPSKMPRNIRNSLPCMCKSPMAHTRNEMALEIDDTTAPEAVVAVFTEVNRFIMAARAQGKQVSVHIL